MAAVTLEQLRFDAGLTPEELAEKVKASSRTIRRIEAGQRPSPKLAVELAALFDNVKPSDIWPVKEPVR